MLVFTQACSARGIQVDDTPPRPGDWGFRPAEGSTVARTPPGFVWRPQRHAWTYTLQCAQDERFAKVAYEVTGLTFNCHCPPEVLKPGKWYWRFRFADDHGWRSRWSKVRRFVIPEGAVAFPMPTREALLRRIPKGHPRLFFRPEELDPLRKRVEADRERVVDVDELTEPPKRDFAFLYNELIKLCNGMLRELPETDEPRKYPPGVAPSSAEGMRIWQDGKRRTRRVLHTAGILAFAYWLSGNEQYGRAAKKLILAAAAWDPKGSTGYLYIDEAGMEFAFRFPRAYTFAYPLLSDAERDRCREVMRIRGQEMYKHLCPHHLWRPYMSHDNRAWHWLGEIGIAFYDEIPEAADRVWFAMTVFHNAYPVWCDDDGGWHEGVAYWRMYLGRFTQWADVMRSAFGIDAYRKPYFARAGYYPMYLQPPGTEGGAFGDCSPATTAVNNHQLMSTLAAQMGNGHWQWYVDALGARDEPEQGYRGFVHGMLPEIEPTPPVDLPSSRCFHGVGLAALNTSLLEAAQNVEIVFKSSPFGTQSCGCGAQNAFVLYAFGERLLVRSGYRDGWASKHHSGWMWHTKSTNNITVNGQSQIKHTGEVGGRIAAFHTSDEFDYVCGDASDAYGPLVKQFHRHILFVKPELIVVFDRLEAAEPSTFECWLHSLDEMVVRDQRNIEVRGRRARCHVSFLAPPGLRVTQSNEFDPPLRPTVDLTQWHLTAATTRPATHQAFVTLLQPYHVGQHPKCGPSLKMVPYGYRIEALVKRGRVVVGLRTRDDVPLEVDGLTTKGDVAAIRHPDDVKFLSK